MYKPQFQKASTSAQWRHPYLKKEINLKFFKLSLKSKILKIWEKIRKNNFFEFQYL